MTRKWRSAQERYWSELSGAYDSLYGSEWSLFEDSQVVEWLTTLCANQEGRALDLGCGTGLGYRLLRHAAPAFEYEGIDISADMLKRLNESFPQARTRQMSIDDLQSILPCSYELVMSLNSALSFSEDVAATLRQAFRVLVPGGALLVSVLNRYSLRRIVSLRFGSVEAFSTRNSSTDNGSVPAHVFSADSFQKIAREAGFVEARVVPQGVLAGVLEHRYSIPAELQLQRIAPGLAHCVYLNARKPRQ